MAIGYFARSNHPDRSGACRDLDASVDKAVAVARAFTGIVEVAALFERGVHQVARALARQRALSQRVARTTSDCCQGRPRHNARPCTIRRMLGDQVPGAVLDDHRGWIDRMRAMAGTAVALGICVLDFDAHRHHIVGDVCHARGHGKQQGGN